jgi:hypothetical protein
VTWSTHLRDWRQILDDSRRLEFTHSPGEILPDVRLAMICPRCDSPRSSFSGELAIHFPGIEGLNKPVVLIFPQLRICLNCGSAELVVPEKERRVLIEGKPVDGALVSI